MERQKRTSFCFITRLIASLMGSKPIPEYATPELRTEMWQRYIFAADKALELEPNNADVLLGLGSVFYSLGQWDKSIELLERAVVLDPLRLETLRSLGFRYIAGRRFEEALEKYNQVLMLSPDHKWARTGVAEVFLRWGNLERALTEINRIPFSGRQNSLKAEILFALGQKIESTAMTNEFLKTPIQQNPFPKAEIYAWRGENDLASTMQPFLE